MSFSAQTVQSMSSHNNNVTEMSNISDMFDVPKCKTRSKNGPGFDSIRKKDGCWIKPSYYNMYTSCVIENTPDEVINGLLIICGHYGNENQSSVFEDKKLDNSSSTGINTFSREIEYRLNKQDFIIDGIVFVNHKPIKFQISVWHDSDDMDIFSPVRVEFQKTRGDSALFHLFWSEMLELMETFTLDNDENTNTNNNNNNNKLFGTISDCTRSGNGCLETFLLPMPLPKLPKNLGEENVTFMESDTECEDNNDFKDDINTISGGLSIDLESDCDYDYEYEYEYEYECEYEYEYTNGDLDDMVLDLISNYRDEALDALATICNKLESNLEFHKLFCQHSKIISIIGNVIISKQNYNNIAKLRGGLCVLLKLIGKKTVKHKSQKEKEKEEAKEEVVVPELATQGLENTQETQQQQLQKRLESKIPATPATPATPVTVTPTIITTTKTTTTKTTTTVTTVTPIVANTGKNKGEEIGMYEYHRDKPIELKVTEIESSEMKVNKDIECAIKCLVNDTNILEQCSLLLENSSKIVQDHTIRLINLLADYILTN